MSSGTASRSRRRRTRPRGPARSEADWARFETEVQKYVRSFGEQIKQQQATFKLQADAQLKAWREAADKFQVAAAGFAVGRRSEIEANLKRRAQACEDEVRMLANIRQMREFREVA
jgi:hypothetical protein